MTRPEWPRDPRTQRYLPHSGYPTTLQPWMRANETRARRWMWSNTFGCALLYRTVRYAK